jgi:mannitol/fructose-specific phosphotransferase system IIA component (Ntr-type)
MTLDKFRANLNAAKTAQEMYDVILQQENAL